MFSKALFLFFLFLLVCFVSCYPEVEGNTSRRRIISNEEIVRDKKFDLELKRQLKFLNKQPIKTIHENENGATFDCVDIHNQPALDHPLLKNHKIQMGPNFRPKGLDDDKKIYSSGRKSKYSMKNSNTILKPLGCPKGTVPIRRTTKEDLIRAKPFFDSYNPTSINRGQTANTDGQHVAIRRSKSNETYYGVFGWIDVGAPFVENDQYSAGQLWVEGGPLDKITTLQAGWVVSPQLFQDNKTRLFGYSNSDINPKGCYNLLCTGFVQTNKDFAFGQELTPSVFEGEQHTLALQIYKAKDDGSWWLGIALGGDQPGFELTDIGYWPGEIYSELVDGASYVAWGGLVKSNSKGQSPDMGTGYAPQGSRLEYTSVCSVVQLQVIYSNFTFVPPNESAFENFVDSKICYGIEYSGFLGKWGMGYSFLFGGPGGNNCGT